MCVARDFASGAAYIQKFRLYDKQFQAPHNIRRRRFVHQIKNIVMNDFGGYEEPTSRAFWGSEDLEDDATSVPKFSVEWLTDSPSSIKTLVVIAGDVVSAHAEKFIVGNAERVCTINSTAEFNVAALYKLKNDLYVFVATSSIDIASAGELLETISEITSKAKEIVAFTNANISKLHGAERNIVAPTFWRSLSTSKGRSQQKVQAPLLKHPNFIAGVAAGVVAYAEMREIPATVYILYVADDAYDAETVEAMIKLFSEVTDCVVPKVDFNSKTFNSNKLKLYI